MQKHKIFIYFFNEVGFLTTKENAIVYAVSFLWQLCYYQ